MKHKTGSGPGSLTIACGFCPLLSVASLTALCTTWNYTHTSLLYVKDFMKISCLKTNKQKTSPGVIAFVTKFHIFLNENSLFYIST